MSRKVAIIPARGGSKGLPGKNVKQINGKPLIAHSIEHCLSSANFKEVYVSTDCPEIERISILYGAKVVRRPSSISDDHASSESAVLHVLDSVQNNEEIKCICFLQCTSPIRGEDDLDRAYLNFAASRADSLLAVVENHVFVWEEISNEGFRSINYDYKNRKRRQDLNPQYQENGSFYLFKPWVIRDLNNRLGGKIAIHVMGEASSHEIDTATDFKIIETLMENQDAHS